MEKEKNINDTKISNNKKLYENIKSKYILKKYL